MYKDIKSSIMPPPVFTSVPSLPMFVVQSGENRMSQLEEPEPSNAQSNSDVTSGGIESETHQRHHRKHSKRRTRSLDKPDSVGEGNSSREEMVLPRRHRHHHHRRKPHKDILQTPEREGITFQGEPTQSDVSEIPTEQQPKPKPRRKLHVGGMEHSQNRTGSRSALLLELDRVTKENKELSRHLQQLSHSSQDSGYQQTAVDETLRKKDEHIERLMAEVLKLERSNRDLETQLGKCGTELEKLENRHTNDIEQMNSLQAKNQELDEDVTMLKNLVYRLNIEVDRYQQKLHKHGGTGELPPLKNISTTVQDKEASAMWNNINKSALGPLLDAYQETIKEKDDLIHNYEQDLNKFVANCKQVVAENEKLYQELEEANKQIEERSGTWQTLQQDASLAQEQNDLLTNQIQLQKDKLQEIQTVYDERELTKDNEMLVNKFHQYRGDLLTMKGQYSVLREEYDKLKKDAENKVPFAVHSASVSECRRLFEELKAKYETDKTHLTSQVQELQAEKPHLEVQLANVTSENKRLQIHVKTLDRLLKKMQNRCEELQSRLVTCQVSRDASKRQLQKAMSFAEELVAEQENLLRQLHAKQEENNSIARLGTTIVCRMGSLKTKLKTVQKDAWTELDVVEKRIRRQETDVGRMKDEYHKEVLRLRNLVKQKEIIIGRLQREKTKTQEDLEVVWRAATSEDIRIKERLKQASLLPGKESDILRSHNRTYN
ncbi:centrosomal protein of 89 kDa isoform X2 [Periplaneta americana]|uniref:centrosomal protein of 89 kDa isoform X2 n=1 Tax=Periplaneta americana TaxID=6978 RepID=UPI0037E81C12